MQYKSRELRQRILYGPMRSEQRSGNREQEAWLAAWERRTEQRARGEEVDVLEALETEEETAAPPDPLVAEGLTEEDIARLLKQLAPHRSKDPIVRSRTRAIVVLLAYSNLELAEIRALQVWELAGMRLPTPARNAVADWLKRRRTCPGASKTTLVFFVRGTDKPLARSNISRSISRAAARAGVSGVSVRALKGFAKGRVLGHMPTSPLDTALID